MTSRPQARTTPVPGVPAPPPAPGGATPEAAAAWAEPAPTAAPDWPLRLLGCVVAAAVTDPPGWLAGSPSRLLEPLLAVLAACFAAVPMAGRPVATDSRWPARLSRHRNTLFLVGCVLLAAAIPPPAWLACCDTALLLGYLLGLDAVVGGPPAVRMLRRPLTVPAVVGSTALVLAAALVPVSATGAWARLLAAVAIAVSGGCVAGALWLRQAGARAGKAAARAEARAEGSSGR